MKTLKKVSLLLASAAVLLSACTSTKKDVVAPTLKSAIGTKYHIGTAMNTAQVEGRDKASIDVIKTHFNSVVAENCMKSEVVQPEEGKFDFRLADKFVEFGEKNNMFIIGHTLIWHSQAPKWFFTDSLGNDVSREVMIQRMKTHIQTVVGRYKGRVHGWDVVNEAILDNGEWRKSKFYKIVGEDFVKLAFQFAHEADPEAELYYNDYSTSKEGKRNGIVKMVKSLQEAGIKVSGIGMQSHNGMNFPSMAEYEKSIEAFAALGVNVMITELDITALPRPKGQVGADVAASYEFKQEFDPYAKAFPDSAATALHDRYMEFFKLYEKHSGKISRVTLWGVNDGNSWLNYWPIRGRTDFPLLFDRQNKPKKIVSSVIDLNKAR